MLTIFTYHSIQKSPYVHAVEPSVFERQLRWLVRHTKVLSLEGIQRYLHGEDNRTRCSACVFDDGFKDNFDVVFPIIQKYRVPITIFVCIERVGRSFTDQKGLTHTYLSWDELHAMKQTGLVSIASHTMTHPLLTTLDLNTVRHELEESRRVLEKKLKVKVDAFSYPKGNFNKQVKEVASQFYAIAFGGIGSMSGGEMVDCYEIPRVIVHKNISFMKWLLMNTRTYWLMIGLRNRCRVGALFRGRH